MQGSNCRHRPREFSWRTMLLERLECRLALASVSGTVWQDNNGDGIRNPGEWGVPATTVFMDKNRDGDLDAGERSTVTDANGQYSFLNTPSGNYNLRTIPGDGWSALPIDRLIGLGSWVEDDNAMSSHNKDWWAALWEIDPENGFAFNRHPIVIDETSLHPFTTGLVADDVNLNGLAAVPGQPGLYMTQAQISGEGVFFDADVQIARIDWPTGSEYAKATFVSLADPLDRLAGGGVAFDPTGDPRLLYGGFGDTYLINKRDLNCRMWTFDLDTGDVNIFEKPSCDCNWPYFNGDIQFDDSGQLYVFSADSSGDLRLLDKTTGMITSTVPAEVLNEAAEYDPARQEFWIAEAALFRLSPLTGVKTRIGPNFDFSAMGTSPDGTKYAIEGLELVKGFADRPVVVSDADVTGIDFGQVSHVVGISGTVFHDTNTNGHLEPRELWEGLQGHRVFLDQNNNGLYDTGETYRWTDKLGNYSFASLMPGIYSVALERRPLHDTTYPRLTLQHNHLVNLLAGQRYRADFGVAPTVTIRGTAYDDSNLDGQRDANEAGIAGATIYVDLDQNGVLNTMLAERISAATTVIPDLSSVTSTMLVSGLRGPLADVDVTLDITHGDVSDLALTLVSPRGTRVSLMRHAGGDGQHLTDTVLDDEASTAITDASSQDAPFTASYRPAGALTDFDGEDANGTWTLEISDDATGTTGVLNHWTLGLTTGDIVTTTGADGGYKLENLPPRPLILRQDLWHHRSRTEPSVVAETTLEDFETDLTAYIQAEVGAASTLQAQGAYHGQKGLAPGAWIYGGPDAHVVHRGDTISAHVKFGSSSSGSTILGFGASEQGTLALGMFPGLGGTGEIWLLQVLNGYDNANTKYHKLAAIPQGFAADLWYRVEIDWGTDGTIVGRLFTADGGQINEIDIAGYGLWPADQGTLAFRALPSSGTTNYVDHITIRRGGERKMLVPAGDSHNVNFGSVADSIVTGVKFQDSNGDGVFNDGRTLPGFRIYDDANQNGSYDAVQTATFGNTLVHKINDKGVTVAEVTTSGLEGLIRDVSVTINIDHGSVGDLRAFLTSPQGTRLALFSRVGGSGDDFQMTRLDDSAPQSITSATAPFAGTYRPESALSLLRGEDPNGVWRLSVFDDTANGTSGFLNTVLINLGTGELDAESTTSGYQITGLPPGPHFLREEHQADWLQTTPLGGAHVVVLHGQTVSNLDFGNTKSGKLSGRVYKDVNQNLTYDADDAGIVGWPVYLDADGNGTRNRETGKVFTTESGQPIPDNGTMTSMLEVEGLTGRILDVNVRLTIEHPTVGDLEAYLVSPAGTRIQLFGNLTGQGADFLHTLFDDEAGQSITEGVGPFSEPNGYRPLTKLDRCASENPNGIWLLQVSDRAALDVGQLIRWQIILTHGDPIVTTDSDGEYAFSQVPPGVWTVRVISQPDWTFLSPADGQRTVTILASENKTGVDFGLIDFIPPEPREIHVPHSVLIPNQPDQPIEIFALGTAPVVGILLRAQIGDGRGPETEPVFNGVDYTGGVWEDFAYTVFGGILPDASQLLEGAVELQGPTDNVTSPGLVARLLVDTTGIKSGTFDLKLAGTEFGLDSEFIGAPVDILNGLIQIALPGDSNLDGRFDTQDLVQILQIGEYEDGIPGNSTWTEGDWNQDGDFDTGDFVLALQQGNYESAAARPGRTAGSLAKQAAPIIDWTNIVAGELGGTRVARNFLDVETLTAERAAPPKDPFSIAPIRSQWESVCPLPCEKFYSLGRSQRLCGGRPVVGLLFAGTRGESDFWTESARSGKQAECLVQDLLEDGLFARSTDT